MNRGTLTLMSELAKQLEKIHQDSRIFGGISNPNTRASILFDPKEAARYDKKSVFDLAQSAIQKLSFDDSYFLKFEMTFLNHDSLKLERSMIDKKENEELSSEIRQFLRYLQPHFDNPEAHYIMEWMIRKYRVHEMDLDAVMDCILPWYQSEIFVKMCKNLFFNDKSKWKFLKEIVQNQGINPDIKVFSKRCLVDRTIIDHVFDHINWVLQNKAARLKLYQRLFEFFVDICTEYLRMIERISQVQLFQIFPIISNFMLNVDSADIQICGITLCKVLSEKITFNSSSLLKLFSDCSKGLFPEAVDSFHQLLIHLKNAGQLNDKDNIVLLEALKAKK